MPPTYFLTQRLPRYMTQTDVRAFFGVIGPLRDLALFCLTYQYGFRVSELALLTRADVDLARRRLTVKRAKGGIWTERPLFAGTARLLASYLAMYPAVVDAPLFPGRTGPLQKRQIQARFVRYRDCAGLDARYTCHSLRHSIATHLLDAGATLEFVQDHLGHRSIRSTSIYAQITDRHREARFRELEASPWIVDPTRSPHVPPEEAPPCPAS